MNKIGIRKCVVCGTIFRKKILCTERRISNRLNIIEIPRSRLRPRSAVTCSKKCSKVYANILEYINRKQRDEQRRLE